MQLGTVAAIYRYPVKAMAAEPLTQARIGWHGVEGDRRYAFVQSDDVSDFPWLTIREVPELTRYAPVSADPPESGPPAVRTPDGRELALHSPELADELASAHGGPVHLHRSSRGLFDAFAVSITSTQTAASLGTLVGRELEPLRFRPTIVIDAPGDDYPEDALVGRLVSLGDAQVRVNVRDERCMVINFDPRTAERDPSVLRAVAQRRDVCLGVYGSTERPGAVRVGDPVVI
jgi:uncharacterized protein YcbX